MPFYVLQSPEKLVKRLAEAGQKGAALLVARSLFQLWDQDGRIDCGVSASLTTSCGLDALRLFLELLQQAGVIGGQFQHSHHLDRPIADDKMAGNAPYEALITAVRRSAEMLVKDDPANLRGVIDLFASYPPKVFVRLALHLLAQNPAAAPAVADTYLTNPELIEASWCRHEYAELALAWFPHLAADKQAAVLHVVDSVADKYRAAWRLRFEEHRKAPPNREEVRIFDATTLRDTVWKWRTVLPSVRQEGIRRIVDELGDPDAWRERLFPPQESPLARIDFAARPVTEIVAFLKSWRPGEAPRRQTVTMLAQELCAAVLDNPAAYAANADQFAGLPPIYVRRVLEGLENAACNGREFAWGNVLKLIGSTYSKFHQFIDSSTIAEGDDLSWTWACTTASQLLMAGLRRGVEGISFDHAASVRSLVFTLVDLAPKEAEFGKFRGTISQGARPSPRNPRYAAWRSNRAFF